MNEPGVGRTAVVTGASGAAGRAVAARLATERWQVAGLDERPSDCGLSLTVDLRDRQAIVEAVRHVMDRLGPVDLLVTTCPARDAAPFGQMELSRWQHLLEGHLASTASACAAILPGMVAAGGGAVVTTTTLAGLHGEAGEAYLAAASGTILAFTKSLAVEVAPHGVRMNCVAVGNLGGLPPESKTLDAVADTVVFLADEGGFYVGQVFELWGEAVV